MDARVLELFGSTSGHGSGGSQGSASNHKPGNGNGVISKKAGAKNKKARARFPRNFKPSNNTPYLPPELVNPTQNRFEHLATQMKWRLQEGRGEAVYQIGVEDNGMLVGLSEEDMRASLKTLHRLAEKVGADIAVLRERELDCDSDVPRKIAEVLIRKVPDDQQGELDNGRGRARLNLFRHLHEIQTGRTSSISFEILGFNSKGEHLGLAMALKVPIFIVISKVDLCTRATVERTVRQLERVLKQPGCNKVPMVVSSTDDAVTAAQQFAQSPNVTGESLDMLKVFFNIIPPLSNSKEQEELMQQLTEFQVDEIYTVPEVGTVVGGTLYSPEMDPTICWMFEAEIVLLFHAKTFHKGFQVTVHIGNVRQTATVEAVYGKVSSSSELL
ncbi:hypothetical protein GOODEAATRI_009207 [Goodea atripinnis]|uniref:GTP binding protein n=1 Tax=Goodea atripinnis TaxID=208336 RepID=A0ABV0PWJ2_9TELE